MQLRMAAPAKMTRYAYVTFDTLLILILLAGAVCLRGRSKNKLACQTRATQLKERRHG